VSAKFGVRGFKEAHIFAHNESAAGIAAVIENHPAVPVKDLALGMLAICDPAQSSALGGVEAMAAEETRRDRGERGQAI
jgi:hypothetical protein